MAKESYLCCPAGKNPLDPEVSFSDAFAAAQPVKLTSPIFWNEPAPPRTIAHVVYDQHRIYFGFVSPWLPGFDSALLHAYKPADFLYIQVQISCERVQRCSRSHCEWRSLGGRTIGSAILECQGHVCRDGGHGSRDGGHGCRDGGPGLGMLVKRIFNSDFSAIPHWLLGAPKYAFDSKRWPDGGIHLANQEWRFVHHSSCRRLNYLVLSVQSISRFLTGDVDTYTH